MLKKLIGINRIIAFTLIGALFVSNTAFSWGYRGHILIAQIAYDNLNTKAKKKADNMASLIFKRLPAMTQQLKAH